MNISLFISDVLLRRVECELVEREGVRRRLVMRKHVLRPNAALSGEGEVKRAPAAGR
jgi:hypothetical protein